MSVGPVVVAHGETALRESAVAVVRAAGYSVIAVADGESARLVLNASPTPAALIVDVALPVMLGYELCDEICASGRDTVVILIASVYSKTAYKRQPSNLYGANDYVEQHHIIDQLVDKLKAALDGHGAPSGSVRAPNLPPGDQAEAIRTAAEDRLAGKARGNVDRLAKNLARLLVADMMLYAGDVIRAWRAAGCPSSVPSELTGDVQEARRLYSERTDADVAHFEEALRAGLCGGRALEILGRSEGEGADE